MQDVYAGDIGDYGKFALLRTIAATTSLRLGVHWWRTVGTRPSNDGRFTDYLTSARGVTRYRLLDPELFDGLRALVLSGARTVAGLERLGLLPDKTTYFADLLSYEEVRLASRLEHRRAWLARSQSALLTSEVLLLDPDNGLQVASVSPRSKSAPKYVFLDEARVLGTGRSLIVYQHIARDGDANTQISRGLRALEAAPGAFAVRHHRGTSRAYLFAPRPEHQDALWHAACFAVRQWDGDFTLIRP